jgi:hypothetical protein
MLVLALCVGLLSLVGSDGFLVIGQRAKGKVGTPLKRLEVIPLRAS